MLMLNIQRSYTDWGSDSNMQKIVNHKIGDFISV